jgi:shikimate kinase
MLQFLIVLAILAVVVIVVTAPLRRDSRPVSPAASQVASQLADLEAAREAKYREIRDAELDHNTGKLSDADFEAVERTLRAEAVEILHALDSAQKD